MEQFSIQNESLNQVFNPRHITFSALTSHVGKEPIPPQTDHQPYVEPTGWALGAAAIFVGGAITLNAGWMFVKSRLRRNTVEEF
jgi:hypothetical protein